LIVLRPATSRYKATRFRVSRNLWPFHFNVVANTMLSISTSDCYFTITPPAYTHWSDETPCCSPSFSPSEQTPADPVNPLLALRSSSQTTHSRTSSMASLMQVQTSAAHSRTPSRPDATPLQNVLHVTSDDSANSSDSSDSDCSVFGMSSPPELARCSRCQRTPSLDVRTGKSNMLQYGLNLWYCNRCAGVVGMTNR